MPFELIAQYLKLPVFALVAARLAGLLLSQPILGALSIPVHFRILLVLALAALVTPFVVLPSDAPATALGLVLAMGGELLLGVLLGLVTVACFFGVQLGGLLIAQEAGIAFGQILDPSTDDEETVLGLLYLQLAAVMYLLVGGHRWLVTACLDTFTALPLLSETTAVREGGELIVRALTLGGHVALRIAGPTLLAMFLVNLALGFISRTMPQFNVLAVGFSLKSIVAFLLMAAALPAGLEAFVDALGQLCGWVTQFLGTG